MNTPALPTAIPHDDSKAWSAERRAIFNQSFANVQRTRVTEADLIRVITEAVERLAD